MKKKIYTLAELNKELAESRNKIKAEREIRHAIKQRIVEKAWIYNVYSKDLGLE